MSSDECSDREKEPGDMSLFVLLEPQVGVRTKKDFRPSLGLSDLESPPSQLV